MALAGEGGELTGHFGECGGEERGTQGDLGGVQEVSEGALGEGGGRGVLQRERVSRVCALGAAGEGRAPQRAAVKAYTGGGGGWWSGCAGGSPPSVGLGMGLRPGKEVRPGTVGVGLAEVRGGEEGRQVQGREDGSTGGRESVGQGTSVVSAGAGEHGAADCPA